LIYRHLADLSSAVSQPYHMSLRRDNCVLQRYHTSPAAPNPGIRSSAVTIRPRAVSALRYGAT